MKKLFTILCLVFGINAEAQDYNLGFEQWDTIASSNLDTAVFNYSPQMHQVPNPWLGKLSNWAFNGYGGRTTDAHNGNFAAYIHLWYNGAPTFLSFGNCSDEFGTAETVCKVKFSEKLYGVSGFYKYFIDSVVPNDTYKKVAMLNIVTYKMNTGGDLEILHHDSLLFAKEDNYKAFYLPITYSNESIVPDSIAIWFETKGYFSGTTYNVYNHFLYLDDLQLHFEPFSLSVNEQARLENKIQVYPNPTNEILNLEYEANVKVQSIQMLDMSGRVIKSFKQNEKVLNVSGLVSGVYFLHIQTEKGSVSEKIVVE